MQLLAEILGQAAVRNAVEYNRKILPGAVPVEKSKSPNSRAEGHSGHYVPKVH